MGTSIFPMIHASQKLRLCWIYCPCRMPEGEEIDAVSAMAVEKPTPTPELEDEELKELDKILLIWYSYVF